MSKKSGNSGSRRCSPAYPVNKPGRKGKPSSQIKQMRHLGEPSGHGGFFIPTPVGNYNPDRAIAFQEGKVKHIYFIAETKGSMSSLELREIEKSKIQCARKFFATIASEEVKHGVIDSYKKFIF